MGFADRKAELLRIVENADEETTGQLIEFARQIVQPEFLDEEIAEFKRRIDEHIANPQSSISSEELITRLKAQLAQKGGKIESDKNLNDEQFRFSDEELDGFHATRQKYADPSAKTILLEDAHAYLRSLKAK